MTPWTSTEARTAKQMRSEGVVVPKIAARLGRSDWSVYGFLRYNYTPAAHAEAFRQWCPHCGARVGEPCLRVRSDGISGLRKSPHRERFPK